MPPCLGEIAVLSCVAARPPGNAALGSLKGDSADSGSDFEAVAHFC